MVTTLLAALLLAVHVEGVLAAPPRQPAPGMTPAQIVAGFLDGWNQRDYESMYSFVSSQTQEQYPLELFRARYNETDNTLNLTGVDYTVGATHLQGITAAVTYDVTIHSALFDDIEDDGRTMRLVQTSDGWRVAWSTMDIFDMLAGDSTLNVIGNPNVRANIYDRNGTPLVEEGGTVVDMYSAKQDMNGVNDCVDLLARIMRRYRPSIVTQFAAYNSDTVFYIGQIDQQEYLNNRADLQNTCGVNPNSGGFIQRVQTRQTRNYAFGGVAAHVTGYVGQVPADQQDSWRARGYQPDDYVGLTGIEASEQDVLAGRAERRLAIVDPSGTVLRDLGSVSGSAPQPVTLTIDLNLQRIVAQALADAVNYALNNWGQYTSAVAAVVLDVHTGEILALASYPSYSPGVFSADPPPNAIDARQALLDDPRRPLIDHAAQDRFSPGSTFKIITATAAAQEGVYGMDQNFDCGLEWHGIQFGDTLDVRYDWKYTDKLDPTGEITMAQAIAVSCDPFFFQMGALLFTQRGADVLSNYAHMMGLGPVTNLEIEEVPSQVNPPETAGLAITSAIGQGDVEVTPLQMAVMMASVANGGTVYNPHLLLGTGDNAQQLAAQFQPDVARTLDVDPDVLAMVQHGLCLGTTDKKYGTSEFVFKTASYSICGKTGTAQTLLYPNGWYVAYTPADNPQLAIAVVVANSREGSETAAPIVRRILDDYYNVREEPFPDWWANLEYIPIDTPEGGVSGG